jgi:hypothetical protein
MIGEPTDPCGNMPTRECTGPCDDVCARYPWEKPNKPYEHPEAEELAAEEFIAKLRQPEGFVVLIDDHSNGFYILHVYRLQDLVVYMSPKVWNMQLAEQYDFTAKVEEAALHPRGSIKRLQW